MALGSGPRARVQLGSRCPRKVMPTHSSHDEARERFREGAWRRVSTRTSYRSTRERDWRVVLRHDYVEGERSRVTPHARSTPTTEAHASARVAGRSRTRMDSARACEVKPTKSPGRARDARSSRLGIARGAAIPRRDRSAEDMGRLNSEPVEGGERVVDGRIVDLRNRRRWISAWRSPLTKRDRHRCCSAKPPRSRRESGEWLQTASPSVRRVDRCPHETPYDSGWRPGRSARAA